jgi:hypothetical protein
MSAIVVKGSWMVVNGHGSVTMILKETVWLAAVCNYVLESAFITRVLEVPIKR